MNNQIRRPSDKDTYTTGTGQELVGVHRLGECMGPNCVIHNPSRHPLREAPTNWNHGKMERVCLHGYPHPDPDDLAFIQRSRGIEAAKDMAVHDCDGCCLNQWSPESQETFRLSYDE